MISLLSRSRLPRRAVAAATMLALGAGLSGCADMGDTALSAFADPAKYDYYDCKQLEGERKVISNRSAELQGLIAKAETGAGGSVVGEIAYRNDYITARAQSKLVEEAWRRNKCRETPPSATTPAVAATPPAKDKPARFAVRQRRLLELPLISASRKSSPAAPACAAVPSP